MILKKHRLQNVQSVAEFPKPDITPLPEHKPIQPPTKQSNRTKTKNFCPDCGARLGAEDVFCHNCGAELR